MMTMGILIPFLLLLWIVVVAVVVVVLLVARKRRSGKGEEQARQSDTSDTLGEVLKAHRKRCGMTQEFVAEAVGVSRQAVSKWESGLSCPSTSNLLTLAKLYGVSMEQLLRQAEAERRDTQAE